MTTLPTLSSTWMGSLRDVKTFSKMQIPRPSLQIPV